MINFLVLRSIARSYNNSGDGWSWQVRKIAQATSNLFHQCGSTTSAIAKAQSASNNIDCNAMTTTLLVQQSFFMMYRKVQQQ
jgi:hypothetical protein